MPSFYIHERVAGMALYPGCGAPGAIAALGACGPDALYCATTRGAVRLRSLGRRLHSERTGEFICALAEACALDELGREYALGFATHYAADTAFHPFVYALSMTPMGYSALRHMAVERALDAWLIGISTTARAHAPDNDALVRIAPCLARALALWAPDTSIGEDETLHVLKRCLSVGGVLGRLGELPASLRVSGYAGEEQLTPARMQAFALRGWRHPWTAKVSHDGPYELLGAALKRGEELAAAMRRFWNGQLSRDGLFAATGGLSYLSGIDWHASRRLEPFETERLRAVKDAFRR